MWGPYGRMPYSRNYVMVIIYELGVAGTYKMQAAISIMFVITVILLALVEMRGRLVRIRLGKMLPGSYELKGAAVKSVNKIAVSVYRFLAHYGRVVSYNRTLAASYQVIAGIRKHMQVYCLASYAILARRLEVARAIGFEYEGDFEPGDRIVISSSGLTLTVNGENMLHLQSGALPFFTPGENTLAYSDSEGSREIKLRVIWRGRWG